MIRSQALSVHLDRVGWFPRVSGSGTFLSLAGLLVAATSLSAQQGEKLTPGREATLVGTVTILGTLRPLSGAEVRLLGRGVSTLTDSLGTYRLSGLEPGRDMLQVRYLSYDSPKFPVRLEAGRSVVFNVLADYPAAVLKELEVETQRTHTAGLVGTVTILGTQRPLSTAVVRLLRQEASTLTDSLGTYQFSGLEPGLDTLEIHYLSFDSEKVPIVLEPRRSVVINLVAAYAAIVMKELTVTVNRSIAEARRAYFERRRKKGLGHFLTREEIEERRAGRMYQLFWRIPGTRIRGNDVLLSSRGKGLALNSGSGACRPVIYVNGGRRPFARLDDFSPWNVEAIEVYRSPFVPAQFADPFNPCGSIVIWTRRGRR